MRIDKTTPPSRLLRVREFTDKVAKRSKSAAAKPTGKSRFVEPFYLAKDERESILELLERTSIGDAEGRQLFLTAAEYEIGGFRLALQSEAAPEPPPESQPKDKEHSGLRHLGESASRLGALLEKLDQPGRALLCQRLTDSDRFKRQYHERYLQQLLAELEHVSGACSEAATLRSETSDRPAISETARNLIVQLARIFGECLDAEIQPGLQAEFCQVLDIIRDSAQISIPTDQASVSSILTDRC